MRLANVVEALGLEVLNGGTGLDAEVRAGYAGDLMSDVIAHAEAGWLWVTVQGHVNVVAVAVMKSLAGIVIANGRGADEDALRRAREEGVVLLSAGGATYEVVAALAKLGVPGRGD